MIRRLVTVVAVSAVAFSGLVFTAPAFAATPTTAAPDACTKGSGPGAATGTIYELQQKIDDLTRRARATRTRSLIDTYEGRVIGLRAGLARLETACSDWRKKVGASTVTRDGVTISPDRAVVINGCALAQDLGRQAANSQTVAARYRAKAASTSDPSTRAEYLRRVIRSENKAKGLLDVVNWVYAARYPIGACAASLPPGGGRVEEGRVGVR